MIGSKLINKYLNLHKLVFLLRLEHDQLSLFVQAKLSENQLVFGRNPWPNSFPINRNFKNLIVH